MFRLLLLTAALIVYGSLYPWNFHYAAAIHPWMILWRSWPTRVDLWVLRDAVLNVVLYVPFGLAAAAFAGRFVSRPAAVAIAFLLGTLLSAAMELLQAYVPGRVTSLADLATNALGALLGGAIAFAFAPQLDRLSRFHPPHFNLAAAFLLALWLCYRLYPFFPAIGRTHIRRSISALLETGAPSPVEIWIQAAEWLAVAAILSYAWPRMNLPWLTALMALLPLQWVILDRALTVDQLAGAAIALAIFALCPKPRRALAALAALASAILLRELSPFHLLARPQPFSWLPFVPTFASSRDRSVVIIAGKAFDYGALLWLLHRARAPLVPAAIVTATALLALEWFQRFLPGRTPESTDAVLTLIMAIALWRLDRERYA